MSMESAQQCLSVLIPSLDLGLGHMGVKILTPWCWVWHDWEDARCMFGIYGSPFSWVSVSWQSELEAGSLAPHSCQGYAVTGFSNWPHSWGSFHHVGAACDCQSLHSALYKSVDLTSRSDPSPGGRIIPGVPTYLKSFIFIYFFLT